MKLAMDGYDAVFDEVMASEVDCYEIRMLAKSDADKPYLVFQAM